MADSYVRVHCKLVRVNPNSFIVENENGEEVVVGRSCVNGIDEPEVANATPGEDVQFRMFEWLAIKNEILIV